VVAVACGGGTPAELSNELVQKGLRVQGDGKNAEAARLYREALVHNADNKFAYYNLGVIDQGAGRIRAAEYKYRLALEVDPRFQAALFNLGTVLSRSNPEAAVRVYENLVELQPDNAGAHLNLGFVLRGLGRGDEADREFDRAVALDPSLRERVESGEGD
jgi:superkiller protein 3